MLPASGEDDLARVFRDWERGALGEAEFVSRVFENLTADNLPELLGRATPDVLARLKAAAGDAPATGAGCGGVFRIESGCGPWSPDIEQRTRRTRDAQVARYRRGVETLRRHFRGDTRPPGPAPATLDYAAPRRPRPRRPRPSTPSRRSVPCWSPSRCSRC